MRNFKLLLLSGLIIFGFACSDSDDDPYIIIKDAAGEIIASGTIIPVNVNDEVKIYTEIGYEETDDVDTHYEWKIDDEPFKKYSSSDGLDITTLGRHNNLSIQKAELSIDFTEDIVRKGSTVIIRIRDKTIASKQVIFEVK